MTHTAKIISMLCVKKWCQEPIQSLKEVSTHVCFNFIFVISQQSRYISLVFIHFPLGFEKGSTQMWANSYQDFLKNETIIVMSLKFSCSQRVLL